MLFILKVHRYKISPRFSTKFLRNEILGAVEFGRWRTTGDQTLIFILIKNKPNVTDYGELHFWNEVSTSRKKKKFEHFVEIAKVIFCQTPRWHSYPTLDQFLSSTKVNTGHKRFWILVTVLWLGTIPWGGVSQNAFKSYIFTHFLGKLTMPNPQMLLICWLSNLMVKFSFNFDRHNRLLRCNYP